MDGGGNTEEALLRRELLDAVNAFLAELPSKKREIFLLRYWYVWSVGDIARRHAGPEVAAAISEISEPFSGIAGAVRTR